jgi:hypothetical protein
MRWWWWWWWTRNYWYWWQWWFWSGRTNRNLVLMHFALVLPTPQWICTPVYVFFNGASHFAFNNCYRSLPFDASLKWLWWAKEGAS